MTLRCGAHTSEYMKDTILTVRLPAATRRRLQALARRERRSLSALAERLIEEGMRDRVGGRARPRGLRPLAGSLRGGAVPTLADFRRVRAGLSASLLRRTRSDADAGR